MKPSVLTGSFTVALFSLLKEKKAEKVLFVTGRHLLNDDVFASLLKDWPRPFSLLHPPEGLLQINDLPTVEKPDTVVAIGGGKVIDFAKGVIHQCDRSVYFVAAPTTAGSGSEATPFAVFYNGSEKVSLSHPALLPQLAVLDPALVKDLPARQKAISGADAFAQCIESVWNVESNANSEGFALEGMKSLRRLLPEFVQSTDGEIAEGMLSAAHLSGKAIALTRTTGPHALSYYLTAHHGVPHGQAVALFLPLFFLYNTTRGSSQLNKIYRTLGVSSAEEAFESCRRCFSSVGLATTFTEAGLNHIDVDALLRSVNRERFANNPVAFEAVVLEGLIRRYLC